MEQVAHNALFNPALPKIAGRLPMMLRDIPGVSDFKMTFLRDSNKIYRSMRVTANLKGINTAVGFPSRPVFLVSVTSLAVLGPEVRLLHKNDPV